jgi:hypothetical protein
MQSIVLQLQADCLDHTVHPTALLRKALVVATKLKLSDFRQWCDAELNGYADMKVVPDYRRIHGEIKVHNPYHGWQPVLFQDSKTQKLLSERKLAQPISELEDVIKSHSTKSVLQMPFPPELLQKFFTGEYLELGLVPVIIVNPSELAGIMDAVRNAILQWTLKLEEQGILGEGLTFTSKEIQTAATSPNIRIDNFQGIFGNVTQSNVAQDLAMTITKGDVDAMCSLLAKKGVTETDLQELREAVQNDPAPASKKNFGKTVSGWIAKMVGKAASGAWDIGVGAAGNLLAEVIGKYYGL